MVTMEEGSLPFPDPIIGVHIPRRKRSYCVHVDPDDHGGSISMEEAATISNGGLREDEMETKKNEKRTRSGKKRRKDIELPNPPPEMPPCMRKRIEEMGGYDIQLVIQKQLEESDVNRNHGRLCLPAKKVRTEFVTEEERRALEEEDEDSNNKKKKKKKKKMKKMKMKTKKGMEVRMMDDVLRESWIWLKKWKIGSRQVYCLMTNWNSFVEESGLRSGDCIQLWSFRKDDGVHSQTPIPSSHRLCFAIVKLQISSHPLSL